MTIKTNYPTGRKIYIWVCLESIPKIQENKNKKDEEEACFNILILVFYAIVFPSM